MRRHSFREVGGATTVALAGAVVGVLMLLVVVRWALFHLAMLCLRPVVPGGGFDTCFSVLWVVWERDIPQSVAINLQH